jgi:cytochrome c oxidase subunit II
VILISMAVPAARTLIQTPDAHDAELSVKATAYPWKWSYEYLGTGVNFDSTLAADSSSARARRSGVDPGTIKDDLLAVDNPLVVPVDTQVRLLLAGNEAAHSRWLPQFAVPRDALPGFVAEAWLKAERLGRYPARCTGPCRGEHGFLPIVVEVLSKEDFARWLAAKNEAARAAAGVAMPATDAATAL